MTSSECIYDKFVTLVADLLAAAVIIEQGTAQECGAVSGRCGGAELAGMYNRHGHRSPAHQQWCALLSLSGECVVFVAARKIASQLVTINQSARQIGPMDNICCAIHVTAQNLHVGTGCNCAILAQTALYADLDAPG